MSDFEKIRKYSPEKIATLIDKYREKHKLTQEGLAFILHIKRNTLLRWENSHVKISNMALQMLIDRGVLQ